MSSSRFTNDSKTDDADDAIVDLVDTHVEARAFDDDDDDFDLLAAAALAQQGDAGDP